LQALASRVHTWTLQMQANAPLPAFQAGVPGPKLLPDQVILNCEDLSKLIIRRRSSHEMQAYQLASIAGNVLGVTRLSQTRWLRTIRYGVDDFYITACVGGALMQNCTESAGSRHPSFSRLLYIYAAASQAMFCLRGLA
jgi:hypothetical protein